MEVTLIDYPKNPLKTIHAAVKNMEGNMIHDMDKISRKEAKQTLKELSKTRLNGALEFGGSYVFQIEDVPRAFTHQAVRNRVGASYSQESMRFAAKTGEKFDYATGESIKPNSLNKTVYDAIMDAIHEKYEKLLKRGAKNEDARGILPINTLTKIGVRFNLMTLIKIAEVRLCYQSQGHWRDVVEQMKNEIHMKVDPDIAKLLRKACSRTGKCEFKSVFDRECPIEKELIKNVCDNCSMKEVCKKENGEFCEAIKKFMLKE